MTTTDVHAVLETGIDGAAIKPAECDVSAAAALPFETVTVDYEGAEHVPDGETLAELAHAIPELRVTVPVRADGFDPLGDDSAYDELPADASLVLVAGHPAYLSAAERRRSIRPRIEAAVRRTSDPWVGTEGIERAALATGATQFMLLSPTTERDIGALLDGGFDGDVAVYAPTVLTDDGDAVLDAVGSYVGRRGPVRRSLPAGGPTDGEARGRAREVLLGACRDYALVGSVAAVRKRIETLREAGADRIVGYPARGLSAFGASD